VAQIESTIETPRPAWERGRLARPMAGRRDQMNDRDRRPAWERRRLAGPFWVAQIKINDRDRGDESRAYATDEDPQKSASVE
jgi:hypothetical protein